MLMVKNTDMLTNLGTTNEKLSQETLAEIDQLFVYQLLYRSKTKMSKVKGFEMVAMKRQAKSERLPSKEDALHFSITLSKFNDSLEQ